jgi:hypothetical protein
VTIADEKDRFGIPVARVTFNLHDNDKKLIEFGKNKVMELMSAAGAEEVVQEPRYAHLVGGARMVRTGAVPLWISLAAPMTSPTSLSVMEASFRLKALPIRGLSKRLRQERRTI